MATTSPLGPGLNWDLTVLSPTSMLSIVYFTDPKVHAQAHQWERRE